MSPSEGSMSRLPIALVLAAPFLYAQSERASIAGAVTDASGAKVANAPVAITNKATNISSRVITTSAGEYSAPNLSPGTYRVEISAPGFRRSVTDNVTLTAGGVSRIDVQLEVGQVSESIE